MYNESESPYYDSIDRWEKDLDIWGASLDRLNKGIAITFLIAVIFWVTVALIYKNVQIMIPAMLSRGFISRYYSWKIDCIEERYRVVRALEEL